MKIINAVKSFSSLALKKTLQMLIFPIREEVKRKDEMKQNLAFWLWLSQTENSDKGIVSWNRGD